MYPMRQFYGGYEQIGSSSWAIPFDDSVFRVRLLQFYISEDGQHSEVRAQNLDTSTLDAALQPDGHDIEHSEYGTLKIAIKLFMISVQAQTGKLQLAESVFNELVKASNLSTAFAYCRSIWSGISCFNERATDGPTPLDLEWSCGLKFQRSDIMMWSFTPTTKTSQGIVSGNDSELSSMEFHFRHLSASFSPKMLQRPSVLGVIWLMQPILNAEYTSCCQMDQLRTIQKLVQGFSGAQTSLDAPRKDYTGLSQRHNDLKAEFWGMKCRAQVLRNFLDSIRSLEGDNDVSCSIHSRLKLPLLTETEPLRDVLDEFGQKLISIGLCQDFFYGLSETVSSAIAQLNIREDGHAVDMNNAGMLQLSGASHDLAKFTQRDAISMRTVAVVTMLFLPATAVATIYQMPFFDWTARGSPKSDRIWIYWVTIIPLTLFTLLIYVWVRASTSREVEITYEPVEKVLTQAESKIFGPPKSTFIDRAPPQPPPLPPYVDEDDIRSISKSAKRSTWSKMSSIFRTFSVDEKKKSESPTPSV